VLFPRVKVGAGGLFGGNITRGRWVSFHIHLDEIKDRETLSQYGIPAKEIRTKDWTTYRHPRNADGAADYGRLVPITLAEVLAAKDLQHL
jgi:hypothetical protein